MVGGSPQLSALLLILQATVEVTMQVALPHWQQSSSQTAAEAPLAVCRQVPKKITAVAFSMDCRHILIADKFGDVLVASLPHQGTHTAACASVPERG